MNKKILIPALAVVIVFGAGFLVYTMMPSNTVNTPPTSSTTSNTNSNTDPMNTNPAANGTPEPSKPPLADLVINDIVVGSGAAAQKGDILTVHYTGKLGNGVVFDSSYVRTQPFEFQLGAGMVIEGWDKGFEGMKIGGRRSLSIPASMAYGMVERGSIPAGSDLYFEVELLGIKGK